MCVCEMRPTGHDGRDKGALAASHLANCLAGEEVTNARTHTQANDDYRCLDYQDYDADDRPSLLCGHLHMGQAQRWKRWQAGRQSTGQPA